MDRFLLFLNAQEKSYDQALSEIRAGRKRTHWIWFVFPQLKGLGVSQNSELYGICDLQEAKEYLLHPILGTRLIEITESLAELQEFRPEKIFGELDALKVRSCMTLFHAADPDRKIFQIVLDKYYDGENDPLTIELLQGQI